MQNSLFSGLCIDFGGSTVLINTPSAKKNHPAVFGESVGELRCQIMYAAVSHLNGSLIVTSV